VVQKDALAFVLGVGPGGQMSAMVDLSRGARTASDSVTAQRLECLGPWPRHGAVVHRRG